MGWGVRFFFLLIPCRGTSGFPASMSTHSSAPWFAGLGVFFLSTNFDAFEKHKWVIKWKSCVSCRGHSVFWIPKPVDLRICPSSLHTGQERVRFSLKQTSWWWSASFFPNKYFGIVIYVVFWDSNLCSLQILVFSRWKLWIFHWGLKKKEWEGKKGKKDIPSLTSKNKKTKSVGNY